MSSKIVTVIAGVGSGTGSSVAKKFAETYPVVLLARKPDSYDSLVKEINKSGGKAIGISADVTNGNSVKEAFSKMKEEYGKDVALAAAVFNASGRPSRKPFMDLSEDDFIAGFEVGGKGAYHFSQASIPLLQKASDVGTKHAPTLIFTGATASLKGSATWSSFATGKFAQRALAQSLAREFGPKGVHVAHAIIDGVINIPATKDWLKDAGPDAKISPEAIADAYWYLHTQPRSSFTFELDLRPGPEKW